MAASYGQSNPGGTDPYPIESVLAQGAITGNPIAQMLLGNYHQQQQADANVYNQSMGQQHEFAKQQLAAQMAEARMKAIPEYLKSQAGAELIQPGAGLGIGDSISPDAAARSLQASRTHEFATNLAEQGKGVESFSRAGQDMALQQIPGLQDFKTTGTGEHSDISVERIKAATALQTAAMHAKAAGGGAGSAITTSFDVPNAYGGTDHASAGRKVTPQQIDAFRRSRGMVPVDQGAPAQALPRAQNDEGGAQSSGPSRTSLPRAPDVPQNAGSGVAAAQKQVLANMDRFRSHPRYDDLVAGIKTNGGKPIVKPVDGKLVVYGASGQPL